MISHDLFRSAAGSFASGVTVVTTGDGTKFHAMTARDIASLSLKPPMNLVCVDRNANTARIIDQQRQFVVNILAESQERLSNAWASKSSPESNGLSGVEYELGLSGLPVITGSLAFLDCEVECIFDGGDHLIVTGIVNSAGLGSSSRPLSYFRGQYGKCQASPELRKA